MPAAAAATTAVASLPLSPPQQPLHRYSDDENKNKSLSIPTVRINPLSVAKGSHFSCELCSAVALHMCPSCRQTYYCSKRHAAIDAFGIHNRICSIIAELRANKTQLGSAEERHRRQVTVTLSQHALIDLAKQTAQTHLIEGKYDFAIAAALQSMRFSQVIYGKGRIESVPSFLIMAEAHLGLNQYHQCEEYLLFAQWAILSTNNPTNNIKSALHRMFGKLYTKQGKLIDAIQQHARDVYYASRQNGPEHIDTSIGYYHLGYVFELNRNLESALASYDKVVDIWYKCFYQLLQTTPSIIKIDPDDGIEPSTMLVSNPMSGHTLNMYCTDIQIEQAHLILQHILITRRRLLPLGHIASAEATYCLGLYKHLIKSYTDANMLYHAAMKIYIRHLGEKHESVIAIKKVINELPTNFIQTIPIPMPIIDLDNNDDLISKEEGDEGVAGGHHRRKKKSKGGKKRESKSSSISSISSSAETSVIIAAENGVETSQVGVTLSNEEDVSAPVITITSESASEPSLEQTTVIEPSVVEQSITISESKAAE